MSKENFDSFDEFNELPKQLTLQGIQIRQVEPMETSTDTSESTTRRTKTTRTKSANNKAATSKKVNKPVDIIEDVKPIE